MWRWDQQEPFGVSAPDENPSGLGAFEFPLRFPGQYADKETNLHYNYFRDYDPAHGRYLQPDPLGLADGVNLYGYVHADPLSRVDPTGEQGLPKNPFTLCDLVNAIQDKCIYTCRLGDRVLGERRCILRPLTNCGYLPCTNPVFRMFTVECPEPLKPNLPPGILP